MLRGPFVFDLNLRAYEGARAYVYVQFVSSCLRNFMVGFMLELVLKPCRLQANCLSSCFGNPPTHLPSLCHVPQKTTDFGNKESASGGRFRLGSVISTVPEQPLRGEQRRPCWHFPSRAVCAPDSPERVSAGEGDQTGTRRGPAAASAARPTCPVHSLHPRQEQEQPRVASEDAGAF